LPLVPGILEIQAREIYFISEKTSLLKLLEKIKHCLTPHSYLTAIVYLALGAAMLPYVEADAAGGRKLPE